MRPVSHRYLFSTFHRSNPCTWKKYAINTHQLPPRKPSEEMAMKVIQTLRFGELSETCCQDNQKAAQWRMPRCPINEVENGGTGMDEFYCFRLLQVFKQNSILGTPSRFSQVSPRFVFLWWFLVSTTSAYPGFGICYVWVILSLMLDTLLGSWGPCQSVSAGTAVALEARVAVVTN